MIRYSHTMKRKGKGKDQQTITIYFEHMDILDVCQCYGIYVIGSANNHASSIA